MAVSDAELDSLNSIGNQSEKVSEFNKLIDKLCGIKSKSKPNVSDIKKLIDFMVSSVVSRDRASAKSILDHFATEIEKISEDYNDELKDICIYSREKLFSQLAYFPNALIRMIRLLSELFQADDEMTHAAKAMASIDTEDQYVTTAMSLYERCDWRIQTARLFLENGDNTNATTHIQKARKLKRDLPINKQSKLLNLQYSSCYARILDSERKFLQAAVNYLELSQNDKSLINEQDAVQSLENAVTCAVLAKAGGPRTRVLSMLYRDERSETLSNFKMLEKMHKNMMISEKEMNTFAKSLLDHHQATLAGGLTVLQKAIYEHNMLAASQLYKNIEINQLAKLLGVTNIQAEDLARTMIQEGRMSATIDQVDEIIQFDDDSGILYKWDANIQDLCMSINDIVDSIDENYPNVFNIP